MTEETGSEVVSVSELAESTVAPSAGFDDTIPAVVLSTRIPARTGDAYVEPFGSVATARRS